MMRDETNFKSISYCIYAQTIIAVSSPSHDLSVGNIIHL